MSAKRLRAITHRCADNDRSTLNEPSAGCLQIVAAALLDFGFWEWARRRANDALDERCLRVAAARQLNQT